MLMPRPRSATPGAGTFTMNAGTRVYAPDALDVADLLRELLGPATGLALEAAPAPGPNVISLLCTVRQPPEVEGYRLSVKPTGVVATAAGRTGLRWAVQALRQLMPPEVYSPVPVAGIGWTVAGTEIRDAPRFPWRGLMLDVGRWYKPIGWLRSMVDLVAMHRMNILHLHLTDDQGWRFEVRRHPRLTEIGAFRRESPLGHAKDGVGDGRPHGGYYTQTELRGLVAYASRRGVTVVPEIDLPGHTQAAVAAYPELGNRPDLGAEVWTGFGVSRRILNVEDTTVAFFRDVVDELIDVFPSPWIHLGGDEVPPDEWAASGSARRRMAQQRLTRPEQLLGWWIDRMAAHVRSRGRRAVVWDELAGQVPPETIVMAWRGEDRVAEALRAGHDVIATPHTATYLNYPAAAGADEPLSIASRPSTVFHGPLSLARIHAYEPVPASRALSAPGPSVLGLQGNLWTEYAATPSRAEYDLMPRLAAIAEVGWGVQDGVEGLESALSRHLRRLDAAGIGYRPPGLGRTAPTVRITTGK
jgi:hexosaminidase